MGLIHFEKVVINILGQRHADALASGLVGFSRDGAPPLVDDIFDAPVGGQVELRQEGGPCRSDPLVGGTNQFTVGLDLRVLGDQIGDRLFERYRSRRLGHSGGADHQSNPAQISFRCEGRGQVLDAPPAPYARQAEPLAGRAQASHSITGPAKANLCNIRALAAIPQLEWRATMIDLRARLSGSDPRAGVR